MEQAEHDKGGSAMPSGKRPRVWGDTYLDAAYDWAGDLNETQGLALQLSLTPTRRKGVWKVVARALHMVDGKPAGVAVQTACEWPDASYQALGPCVFGLVSRLAMDLQTDALLGTVREA